MKTKTQIDNFRKIVEREDIKSKKKTADTKIETLQNISYKDYYQPQEYVKNPKHTAMWQKQQEKRYATRGHHGLVPGGIEINPEKLPDPTIKYVKNPPINV